MLVTAARLMPSDGAMVLKRHGHGLVELYGWGQLGFRSSRFKRALGEAVGEDYFRKVADLFPEGIQRKYVPADRASRNAEPLFRAVRQAVEQADGSGRSKVF